MAVITVPGIGCGAFAGQFQGCMGNYLNQALQKKISDCQLFKVVAWDHVSFPGNDYFNGTRYTDDGVSAGATNAMEIVTGIAGKYEGGYYLPTTGKIHWKQVVVENEIHLRANGNVKMVTCDGQFMELVEFERKKKKNIEN